MIKTESLEYKLNEGKYFKGYMPSFWNTIGVQKTFVE